MRINYKYISDILVISPSGRIDSEAAFYFESATNLLINDMNRNVILDLSKLVYINSAGLRSIILSAQKTRSLGGALILYGLTGSIERVFRISGFDKVLGNYTNMDSAVSELKELTSIRFAA